MSRSREDAQQHGVTLRAVKPTMNRRAVWHDYYLPGRYGITVHIASDDNASYDRTRLFGRIEGSCNEPPRLPDGQPNPQWPHIVLSELGVFVDYRIRQISSFENYRAVKVVNYSIMPTHLHLTLEVTQPLPIVLRKGKPLQLTLGHLIGYFKSGCTSFYNRWLRGEFTPYVAGSPEWLTQVDLPYDQRPKLPPVGAQQGVVQQQGAPQQQSAPQFSEGNSVSAGSGESASYRPLWEANYNDKILNTTRKTEEWVMYVEMNAYFWRLKDEFPHLFEHRLHLNVRMKDGEMVDFSAYGCMFLLRKGDRAAVMCHRLATKDMLTAEEWAYFSQPDVARRYEDDRRQRNLGRWDRHWRYTSIPDVKTPIPYTETAAFRKQMENMLQLARQHTILVSPAVSDGEKDIIYSALHEGCPVIKLHKDPFTGKNHPTDKDRQWCAQALMLILAPWEIPSDTTMAGPAPSIPNDSKYSQFHNLNVLATRMCDEISDLTMIKLYEE